MSRLNSSMFFLLFSQAVFAQNHIYLNPGFKFGYSFGESGGFIIGIEISATAWDDYTLYYGGPVFSASLIRDDVELHFGVEGGNGLVGADIGLTWLLREEEFYLGYNITPYFGLVLIPYFNYVYFPAIQDLYQTGLFLKFSTPVKGRRFKGVGG